MLQSINVSTSRVVAAIMGLAACSLMRLLCSHGEGEAVQTNMVVFNATVWEPPAPLAGTWPRFMTCGAVTEEQRLQGYARARSVLRAADSFTSRFGEIATYLQANSAGLQLVLPAFEALEEPFVQLRAVLQSSAAELSCLAAHTSETGGSDELQDLLAGLPRARGMAVSQVIKAVLAGRRASVEAELFVSHCERETFGLSNTINAVSMFQRLEDVVVSEAEMDQNADAHFDVGMLFSEVFLISQSRKALENAEKYLRKGEEITTEPKRRGRALARAERMHQHAEVLAAELELDSDVAGSRFQNAVKIAVAEQDSQVASRYLARYAHFLDGHGNLEQALNTARKALDLNKNEPLARYLQVRLSRRLGELRTTGQIRLAETHLNNIAGRLETWPEIEAARATLHEELNAWHQVAEVGSHGVVENWLDRFLDIGRACVQHGDVGMITLCLLCKTILPA